MREGWEFKTISDVAKIVAGGTPKTNIKEYWDGDISWITPADLGKLTTREVNITRRTINIEGLQKSSAKLFPAHSVILSSRAPIGHLAINTIPMSTNQGCRGLVPNDGLDTVFLYYFLKSNIKLLNELGTGTTFKELSTKALGSVLIPIPPLYEQKQIVAILDKTFAVIDQAKANIKKNIQNAKELFQSELNEIFSDKGDGWEEKKMDEVCEITSKLINPNEDKYKDLLHVGGGNVIAETGELIDLKTAKEEGLKSGKFVFDTGVVLYNKIRPYLVKVSRPDFNGLCSADMYPLTPNEKEITRDFLYFLLISKDFTDYAIKGSARAGMPKVNRKHLFEYTFSLPSIETQNVLIKDLDSLRLKCQNLKLEYRNKLKSLEELKESILLKAFTGELSNSRKLSLSPEEKHALLIIWAYSRHRNANTELTFGHTKSEKIVHLFENYAEIDLNRNPIKDAAGPNDFGRVVNVIEPLATTEKYYSVVKEEKRYTYTFGRNSFKGIKKLEAELSASQKSKMDKVISLLVLKNTEEAELIATVYSAWNNLLIRGEEVSDEAIVYESRENWHPKKLEIERKKFFKTIKVLKSSTILPKGNGKLVEKKTLF